MNRKNRKFPERLGFRATHPEDFLWKINFFSLGILQNFPDDFAAFPLRYPQMLCPSTVPTSAGIESSGFHISHAS